MGREKKIPRHRLEFADKKILFFSDVHLGSPDGPPQEVMIRLIDEHAADAGTVCIVGDLFDFWYGYQTVVFHQFLPILFRLKQLSDSGIAVHYIAGNHDFCLGPVFRDQLGVETWDGELDVQLGAQRLFLAHGDLVDPEDRGYRLLHTVVRSRPMGWLIRMIPPDLGWKMAMFSSRMSRKYSSGLDHSRRDLFLRFSRERFGEGFDTVLMGHSHQPELHTEQEGSRAVRYINTGDWVQNWTYVLYEPETGFSLHHFERL